jgi:hypothetical protein
MAELRIPIVVENKGKKAFSDTNKSLSALDKGVKRLGASLAATFGAQQLLKFAKNASKAFMEDQKAATQLAQAVKNLGLAFDTLRIEEFISQLSKASGVTDDQLRPSMQKLLQTTGSLTKSTQLLTQALDISRGSGVDFETVVNDLSMAYVGQTRGLRKYSLGLTQAELKTMSFADVQAKLVKQFTGANAAYLTTYAGKMELLTTAAGEAQETIGEGLIDALMILSGDTTVADLATTMKELSDNTALALTNLAKFGKGIQDTVGPIATIFEKFITYTQPFFDSIVFGDALSFAKKQGDRPRMGGYPSSALGPGYIDPNAAARKKAEADALKRAKELAALQKKTLDSQKKQNALTKASKTLDLDRIGATAALKGKISETDRLSLELQLALLDKNDVLATKLSADLEAAVKRNNELRAALLATPLAPNPYAQWIPPIPPILASGGGVLVGSDTGGGAGGGAGIGGTIANKSKGPGGVMPDFNVPSNSRRQVGPMGGLSAGVIAGVNPINVTVVLDGDVIAGALTELQQNDSLSGTFSSLNRSEYKGAVAL